MINYMRWLFGCFWMNHNSIQPGQSIGILNVGVVSRTEYYYAC